MQPHFFDVFKNAGFGGIFKSAVFDNHIGNLRILETDKIKRPTAFFGGHILQMNVAHDRGMLTAFLIILQIDADHCLFNLANANAAHEQVFEIPAPPRIGFESNRALEVGTVHHAVFDKDIANAAAHFTAQYDATMAIFHPATANDDVFAGHADAATVGVAARLDRDAIVAGVERAFLDKHIAARLWIAAVVVGAVTGNCHAADSHILAEDWI